MTSVRRSLNRRSSAMVVGFRLSVRIAAQCFRLSVSCFNDDNSLLPIETPSFGGLLQKHLLTDN